MLRQVFEPGTLDKHRFEKRPDLLGALGERLAEETAEVEPEAVRSGWTGARKFTASASASMASEVPFIIVRSENEEYGMRNWIEGPFQRGELGAPRGGTSSYRGGAC